MPTVLLAEADRELRDTYRCFLSRRGFHVDNADNGLACVAKLRRFVPELLILDLELPCGGGDGVLGFLREEPRLVPNRIVLTSAVAATHVFSGLTLPPVVHSLIKPFPLSALLERAALMASDVTKQRPEGDQRHGRFVVDDEAAVREALLSPKTLRELEVHVQRRLSGQVRNLRLSIRDEGLVLDGHTQTYYAKQVAQHAVMEAVDLPIRANEIKVV